VADVFLSYAREDKERAHRLADAIEARGFDVWWDAEIPPGETWDQMIERELAAARCAVVLWSMTSIGKTWVRTEATEAQKRRVLIPVLLDDVEQPIAFRLTQTVSLVGWDGDDDHPGFQQLLGAVERLVEDPATPPETALRDAKSELPTPGEHRHRQRPTPPPAKKARRWPLVAGVGGLAVAAAVFFTYGALDRTAPPRDPDPGDLKPASRADEPAAVGVPGRYPFTSERYLSASDLRALSDAELRIMRNEIFARHGYIFKTDAMRRYFSQQPWYRPESHNVADRLSPIELANVETIKAVENSR
jgi:hypothetical protein